MLIRRIKTHLEDQNWTAVALDLGIVVLGVFLGLQAQEWNERRETREIERDYLEGLTGDFEAIDAGLQNCLSVYEDGVWAVRRVSEVIEADPQADLDTDAFRAALVRMTAERPAPARSATFVALLSSGELRILRDARLRAALTEYDQQAQSAQEIWRALSEASASNIDALYANVDLQISLDAEQMTRVTAIDLEGMRRDPDFGVLLTKVAGARANAYEICRGQLEQVRRIRALLGR